MLDLLDWFWIESGPVGGLVMLVVLVLVANPIANGLGLRDNDSRL
jgi:hypothetical protein